jgi:P-type Cu+ transporter
MPTTPVAKIRCYHCGENCIAGEVPFDDKIFCCAGCRMVYEIINQNDLCRYYDLNLNPGINQRTAVRPDKFSFLDNKEIRQRLISFADEQQTHVTFYLPQIHCSSCLYLLENLHKFDEAVISSRVNFTRKEVEIVYLTGRTTLRKSAELLTSIGYRTSALTI